MYFAVESKLLGLSLWLKKRGFEQESEWIAGEIDSKDISTPTQSSSEEDYFGEWRSSLDEIAIEISKKGFIRKGIKYVGSGAFRTVVSPDGEEDLLIKIPNFERDVGRKMNRSEFEKQLEFEGLFPKVYAHADDFSWIIVERVSPISDEQLASFFPKLSEMHSNRPNKSDLYPFSYFLKGALKAVASNSRSGRGSAKRHLDKCFGEENLEVSRKINEIAKSSPLLQKLSRVISSIDIEPNDLGLNNLGLGPKNNLVIIDATIRSDFIDIPRDPWE